MTQASRPAQDHISSYPTSDAGPYSADQWAELFAVTFTPPSVSERGPFYGYLNNLAVSLNAPGPPPVFRVVTGAAWVNGHFFHSDANVDFTIAAPAANPRIDRVVVAVNNTNALYTVSDGGFTLDFPDNLADYNGTNSIEPYTARLCIVQGVEGAAPAAPGLDQNINHYMIPLHQYQIDVAGATTGRSPQQEFVNAETVTDFVPIVETYNQTDGANDGRTSHIGWFMPDNKLVEAYSEYRVPFDFISGMTVTPVFATNAAGNIYIRTSVRYGQCGEAYNTHTDQVGFAAVAITNTPNGEINCVQTVTLANEAIDDILTLTLERDATDVLDTLNNLIYIKGFNIEYLRYVGLAGMP